MYRIYELDPGPTEEPEDTSLNQEETRKRRFGRKSVIIVILIVILLSILVISVCLMMLMKEEAPSITEFHSSTKVLPVGHTAQFSCDAGGTPEPTVEWLHNGRPLERDSTDNQSEPAAWLERGFLFIRGVKSGVNTVFCMATNSAGTANHTAELLVVVMPAKEEAPSITEFHSSTKVLPVGHTAQFSCDAGGTPEPTVEWLHNGRPLERDSTDNQSEPAAWVERGFLFVRGVKSGVNTVCCM
ncbi:unnamed protein product, partial [Lota lota]